MVSLIRCEVVGSDMNYKNGICDRFNAPVIREDGFIRILYLQNERFEHIDLKIDPDKYEMVLDDANYNQGSLFVAIRRGQSVGNIIVQ